MGFDFFQNKQEMDVSSFFSQKVKITPNTAWSFRKQNLSLLCRTLFEYQVYPGFLKGLN
jgi:hypothetical protein